MNSLAERHEGIIVGISVKYWRMLPMHVQYHFQLEDMISEITLHIIRRAGAVRKRRGKESTFVYIVAENYAKVLLQKSYAKKRTGYPVWLDAPNAPQLSSGTSRLGEAKSGVESVLRFANEEQSEVLGDLLAHQHQRYRQYQQQPELLASLRALAQKSNTTYDDFIRVLNIT